MALKSINDLNRHVSPITAAIEEAVSRVIASGWFVLGPEVSRLEEEFATYNGVQYCVTLANGTDALELALRALNIGPKSNVLTVANAGLYSTVAILATGAKPIYVDVDPETSLIDIADFTHVLENNEIHAIVVTHLYGLMADVQQVVEFAKSKSIPVIEDCAQAHGAMINGKKAGSFGDIGCFSFYPTKNLGALGDGGAIISSRLDLAERVKQLRQYGWESKYRATVLGGRNSRLDELQAAVLRAKLPFLDKWNVRRREIAARYSNGIKNPKIAAPVVRGQNYVAHLYVIKATNRDALKQYLFEGGIPSDIHYPTPDYLQSSCKDLFPGIRKAVTERNCAQVLTLPCFPEMTNGEVDMIIDRVNMWQ